MVKYCGEKISHLRNETEEGDEEEIEEERRRKDRAKLVEGRAEVHG